MVFLDFLTNPKTKYGFCIISKVVVLIISYLLEKTYIFIFTHHNKDILKIVSVEKLTCQKTVFWPNYGQNLVETFLEGFTVISTKFCIG